MTTKSEPTYVTIGYPGYEGWSGVLNGIVSESNLSGTIVSVSIAPPPDFNKPLTEVYLPIHGINIIECDR